MHLNRVGLTRRALKFISLILLGTAIALSLSTLAARPSEPTTRVLSSLPGGTLTEAATLLQPGTDLYEAERFADAVIAWQQAASTFRTQGQELNLALVLSNLSAAYQELGQWLAAEDTISESLALLDTLAAEFDTSLYSAVLARALNHRGSLLWSQGQLEEAVEVWQQAASAYATAKDETGAIGSLLNQAKALQTLGLAVQSESLLLQVSQRLEQSADSDFKATGLRQLGSALRRVGKLDEAQETLERSLALTTTPRTKSSAFLELGNTNRVLRNRALAIGDEEKAQTFTQAALNSYEQAAIVEDPNPKIRAQLNQFSLLIEIGEQTQALALLPEIQTGLKTLPPGRSAVYAHLNLAQSLLCLQSAAVAAVSCQRFLRARPDNPSAFEHPHSAETSSLQIGQLLATALQQAEHLSDQRAQSHALGQLGELYELTQQWTEAQALTEQALAAIETIRAPEIRYRWEWQLGRLLEAEGDIAGAIAAYSRSIDNLKVTRNDLLLVDPEVQFSFRDNVEPVYRRLISLLVNADSNRSPSQSNLTLAIQIIDDLQLAELENYLNCTLSQRVQLSEASVDPSAAIFHLITLPDQLVVILKLPESEDLILHTTSITKQQVEATLTTLRRELGNRYPSTEGKVMGEQVYDWVIRPVESLLAQSQANTLVFVLDGLLRSVPMASLYNGQQYLIEKYAIALTPNSLLFKPEALAQNQFRVQAFGISDFQSDNPEVFPHHRNFGDLLYVSEELEQLQQSMSADGFLNAQFTRQTLQTQILTEATPIVHIATHGLFSSDPRETYIIAWDDRIDVFNLSNILQNRGGDVSAPLELLVLSACQTAAGDDRAILGLAGIAVQSGARSTLSSLWIIQDQSTATLMRLFYQALTDPNAPVTRAEALRQAQLQLMKIPGYRAPYYWAPFVMVGGWL
ncbi:MAG: CHAT domain-containing protein [Cyanobacteria bacterium J06626_18]